MADAPSQSALLSWRSRLATIHVPPTWPGNDTLSPGKDGKRDEIYCGKGKDVVEVGSAADKIDYVDDSCEIKEEVSLIAP
jgi:hypothetical protein